MNWWRCHNIVKSGVNLWSRALIHNHPTRQTDEYYHSGHMGHSCYSCCAVSNTLIPILINCSLFSSVAALHLVCNVYARAYIRPCVVRA